MAGVTAANGLWFYLNTVRGAGMTSAESVAAACRVIAASGLVEHVLGHVSAAYRPDRLLVRCRGPRESGLAWTTGRDCGRCRWTARGPGAWTAPNELPIHPGAACAGGRT